MGWKLLTFLFMCLLITLNSVMWKQVVLIFGIFISLFLGYSQQDQPIDLPYAETKMEALKLKQHDKGESLLYRQYSPEIKDGEKYPLLIFLHGHGERGKDNTKQLVHCADDIIKYIEKNESAFLLMPQCSGNMRWVRYERPILNPPHKMCRYPTLPLQMVEKLIETKIEELPIDTKRIYVAGLSMGGFATWELLSRRPDLFAAGIPICGGGDPDQAEKMKHIPIWAFQGEADTVVVPQFSTLMVDALNKAGAKQVKYTGYTDVGHDSWTATAANPKVWEWLFSKRKP